MAGGMGSGKGKEKAVKGKKVKVKRTKIKKTTPRGKKIKSSER